MVCTCLQLQPSIKNVISGVVHYCSTNIPSPVHLKTHPKWSQVCGTPLLNHGFWRDTIKQHLGVGFCSSSPLQSRPKSWRNFENFWEDMVLSPRVSLHRHLQELVSTTISFLCHQKTADEKTRFGAFFRRPDSNPPTGQTSPPLVAFRWHPDTPQRSADETLHNKKHRSVWIQIFMAT